MSVSILEQAKIQARVLVPLVKALQAELGQERANSIVRQALGGVYRSLGEKRWRARHSENLGQNMASAFEMYAAEHALEYKVHAQSPDTFDVDVTECRYAQFFRELGAPELGFLPVCSSDFDMAEGFGPDIELKRTQTIMQGASHCDFRYRDRSRLLTGRAEVRPTPSLERTPTGRAAWPLPTTGVAGHEGPCDSQGAIRPGLVRRAQEGSSLRDSRRSPSRGLWASSEA